MVVDLENVLDLSGSIIASKRFDGSYENNYFFYNYDYRGSTTAIIKPDGTPVKEYTYDEFGNLAETGDASFSVRDASTELQYMNARYYQPTTGPFKLQVRKALC